MLFVGNVNNIKLNLACSTVKLNKLHNVQVPYIQRLKSQNLDTEAGRSRVQGSQLLSELKVRMD